MAILLLIAGLVILVAGAEAFVRGAAGLARRLGISALVVGLTVVAFGTSAPELAVALNASYAGEPDLAVGNAVGSNIFNVLLILGVTALVSPLVVDQKLVRLDMPIMLGAAILLWVLAADGTLDRVESGVLAAGIVGYTLLAVILARRESAAVKAEYEASGADDKAARLWVTLVLLAIGLAGIVIGSDLLVRGATQIALYLGVSELVVGLTIVAAGTSLPEVATSIVAALRGHRDIAVGNIVGSNIFNILCILGVTGLLTPMDLPFAPSVLAFDLPVMVASCVVCLPIFLNGFRVGRLDGAILLAAYIAYMLYVVLDAAGHDSLAEISGVTVWFVLPLSLIGFAGMLRRRARKRRDGGDEPEATDE